MVTFYSYRLSPNGAKVYLFLEEAGQPYTFSAVDLVEKDHLKEDSMSKNGYGRIPYIEHEGFVLPESNVIMRYLAQVWGLTDWYPNDLQLQARIDQWMDYGAVHINYPYSVIYLTRWFGPKYGWGMDILGVGRSLRDLARNLPPMERQLEQTPYLVGEQPTIADLSLLPFLALSEGLAVPLTDYPAISRWVGLMTARKSWQTVCHPEWPVGENEM